jgi:hypothetical protein
MTVTDHPLTDLYRPGPQENPPFTVEDECPHGHLPTDRRIAPECRCWDDLRGRVAA